MNRKPKTDNSTQSDFLLEDDVDDTDLDESDDEETGDDEMGDEFEEEDDDGMETEEE